MIHNPLLHRNRSNRGIFVPAKQWSPQSFTPGPVSKGPDRSGLEHWYLVLPTIFWLIPRIVPSGYVKIAIEAMAIEIVDFPIKNGDFQ